ncbi:MAG: class I SAM-dependent methyltransferase [Elusimicrobiota bacterium]
MKKKYLKLARHYESCLEKNGDTYLGAGWPDADDAELRFKIMLEVINSRNGDPKTLLDFGCGTGHLCGYVKKHAGRSIKYSGLDISESLLLLAKEKYPDENFYQLDIMDGTDELPLFDYIVANGVFTQKRELSLDDMLEFMKDSVERLFSKTRKGLAFNVMSPFVDWENPGNFYLPFNKLTDFLRESISRNFVIRHDYGLYEYTVYVYK